MPPPLSLSRARLLKLARSHVVPHARAAKGLCLASSLEFARLAALKGHTGLQLVRWRVKGDQHFLDHWAVWLDEHFIIDLTRAQVDGQTREVNSADSYPANYCERQCYPAELLLASLPWRDDGSLESLQRRHLMQMAWRLFRFDLKRAMGQRSVGTAGRAGRNFLAFHLWLALRDWGRSLQARSATLNLQIAQAPHYAPGAYQHGTASSKAMVDSATQAAAERAKNTQCATNPASAPNDANSPNPARSRALAP